jgi:hypothetical protein
MKLKYWLILIGLGAFFEYPLQMCAVLVAVATVVLALAAFGKGPLAAWQTRRRHHHENLRLVKMYSDKQSFYLESAARISLMSPDERERAIDWRHGDGAYCRTADELHCITVALLEIKRMSTDGALTAGLVSPPKDPNVALVLRILEEGRSG